MLQNQLTRKKVAGIAVTATIIGGIFLAFLKDALSGIIGNEAYALLPGFWDKVIKSIQINTWPWIITLFALLFGFSGMLYLWQQGRLLKYALHATNQIVNLDDSLLRQLASTVDTPDIDNEMRRVLERLLQNATQAFPEDAYKTLILIPDTNKEYLQISANYQMSAESIIKTQFYIGKNQNRNSERGTAGLTYLDEKVRVGRVSRSKNSWEWDAEGYVYFGNQRPYPSHYSFISMPIIGIDPSSPSGKTACLGVVCFDSYSSKIFDSPQIQKFLQTFLPNVNAVGISQDTTFQL